MKLAISYDTVFFGHLGDVRSVEVHTGIYLHVRS